MESFFSICKFSNGKLKCQDCIFNKVQSTCPQVKDIDEAIKFLESTKNKVTNMLKLYKETANKV